VHPDTFRLAAKFLSIKESSTSCLIATLLNIASAKVYLNLKQLNWDEEGAGNDSIV